MPEDSATKHHPPAGIDDFVGDVAMSDYEPDPNALTVEKIQPAASLTASSKLFMLKPEGAVTALATAQIEPRRPFNAAYTNTTDRTSFPTSSSSDHGLTSLASTQGLASASSNTATPASTNVDVLSITDRSSTLPTAAQVGASSSSNAITTDETDNANDVALSVPTNPKDFAKTFGDAPYKTIVQYANQLRLRRQPPTPLTPEQSQHLKLMLRAFSSINSLTPKLEKELHLRQALEVVMGDHPQCRVESTVWKFPDDCIAIATTAHRNYTSENWGANDNLQDDADAIIDNNTAGPPAATNQPPTATTAAPNTNTTRTVRAPNGLTLTVIRRPRPDHPIYGANGIMRGILIDTSGKAKSYKIDDQYPTVSYKVFGHNGLVIGQWWPMQICALRDGAHGMRMAGIAGSQTMGVTSIVVSGTYEEDSLHLPVSCLLSCI